MAKRNKSLIKITFLVVCLLAAGYFVANPKIIEIKLPLAQVLQTLPAQTAEEKSIELIFVGDIMLDRGVEAEIKNHNDWNWPFLKIADELKSADIIFGNLEGSLSDKGEKSDKISSFRMDPKVIEGLSYANFNVLSLANNHVLDYGKEALGDTILRLKEAGIDFAPLVKEINGTKFAFLAYTDFCSPSQKADMKNFNLKCLGENDLENLKKDIENAKKSADIVIISLHYGNEFTQNLSQNQIDFSKAAIDAGADLIIGHHPHVVQKNEIYKGKYIFYSLGNFVFDQNFSEETMEGIMVKVIVKNNKITEVTPINIKINSRFQPEIAEKSAKDNFPQISLSATTLKQGDTLLIKIPAGIGADEITGQFGSSKISFFKFENGLAGIVGIDAKKTPGIYKLTINFPDNYKVEKQIEVQKGNFKITTLAFTPELEKKGYSATSVKETIAKNDGPKLYDAMATSAGSAYFDKSFAYPLDKIANVGGFGNIRKSGSVSLRHFGVDLDADMNTPVYAINDGVVKATLELIDYGNTMVIDHGLGIFSLYLHLDKFNVTEGQKVTRGQIIGLSGNTGYSIAPHLHFSVKAGGASVDPLKFIETLGKE